MSFCLWTRISLCDNEYQTVDAMSFLFFPPALLKYWQALSPASQALQGQDSHLPGFGELLRSVHSAESWSPFTSFVSLAPSAVLKKGINICWIECQTYGILRTVNVWNCNICKVGL